MMQEIQVLITGVMAPPPPAKVLRQEDFKTKYWEAMLWWEHRSSGTKELDANAPILSMFMEDRFGELVLANVRDEVHNAIQSYWIDIRSDGEEVHCWTSTGLWRKEDFQDMMERKFPWLKPCSGHWRSKQLWINYFRKLKKAPSNKLFPILDNKSTKSDEPKEKTQIEISSDDSNPPANIKHRQEGEEEPQPPKRYKGKEKEAAPSTPHHLQAQPKRKKAKLEKVSLSMSSVARPPLIGSRLTYCILFFPLHILQTTLTLCPAAASRSNRIPSQWHWGAAPPT